MVSHVAFKVPHRHYSLAYSAHEFIQYSTQLLLRHVVKVLEFALNAINRNHTGNKGSTTCGECSQFDFEQCIKASAFFTLAAGKHGQSTWNRRQGVEGSHHRHT